jgi:hypothetical protein
MDYYKRDLIEATFEQLTKSQHDWWECSDSIEHIPTAEGMTLILTVPFTPNPNTNSNHYDTHHRAAG